MSGERQYDRCAYESYIRDLGEENSTLRAAFRTAFFEAMRSELTARQYEVLRLETVEGMNGKEVAARPWHHAVCGFAAQVARHEAASVAAFV